MKLLYDFFPVILFFVAYKTHDIFAATAVAIVASVIQVGLYWLVKRRFETAHLVSAAIITVMGGLTLLLHDNTFIMWKPTIINGFFALVFVFSHFIGDKPIIQRMLSKQIDLPQQAWTRLSISWIVFFIISAAANLFVAYTFSEATWVNFKVFGLLALTIIFVIAQAFYLAQFMPQEAGKQEHDK